MLWNQLGYSMVTRLEKWLQLLFRDQFKGVYHRILNHWLECHLDLSLRVGLESVEHFLHSVPFAGLLEDLEIFQQRCAAAENVEDPTAWAALAAVVGTEESLGEQ